MSRYHISYVAPGVGGLNYGDAFMSLKTLSQASLEEVKEEIRKANPHTISGKVILFSITKLDD